MAATIVPYVALENLLEDYRSEPVFDSSCTIKPEDPDDGPLENAILESLPPYPDLGGSGHFATLLAECIQNIRQHSANSAKAMAYQSQDHKKLIFLYEFNEETQFNTSAMDLFLKRLGNTAKAAEGGCLGKSIWEQDGEHEVYFGMGLFLCFPEVSRIGIADIGSKAYFFFEYY